MWPEKLLLVRRYQNKNILPSRTSVGCGNCLNELFQKESYWIFKFNVFENLTLNEEIIFRDFLYIGSVILLWLTCHSFLFMAVKVIAIAATTYLFLHEHLKFINYLTLTDDYLTPLCCL